MNELSASGFAWANQTNLHTAALATLIVLGAATLILPRRWAVLPTILSACFIPPAQRIVILGLNFDMLRILVLLGWIRLLAKNETKRLVFKPIDYALIAWILSGTIVYTALNGTFEALKYKLGTSFDAIGMYFLFRNLIRNDEDICRVIRFFMFISIPVMIAFSIEYLSGRNIFSIFGYVPAVTIIREGRLRCQGAFAHPILAGCFWVSLMPLMAAQWWRGPTAQAQTLAALAVSGMIVLFCGSSTPLVSLAMGFLGACLFPYRRRIKWLVLGLVLILIELHFMMKAPVWHLLARADVISGSTGWYRYHLINETIKHFDDWWLLGTVSTSQWGWGLGDVTNQYVLEGVRGGLITLLLFLWVIFLAFRGLEHLWLAGSTDRQKVILAWALGISLYIHCLNFFAVSYFGQIILIWYMLLAMIGSLIPVRVWAPATFTTDRVAFRQRPYRKLIT